MEEKSGDKIKPSRRNFTKTIATSLLSVPLAISSASAATPQRKNRKPLSQKAGQTRNPPIPFEMRVEHDKPPTGCLITDKPFTMELNESNYVRDTAIGGAGKTWHLIDKNSSKHIHLADIKILHGSGEMLYKNLNAAGCMIKIWLDESPELNPSLIIRDDIMTSHPENGRQVKAVQITASGTSARRFTRLGNSLGNDRFRYPYSITTFRITKIEVTQNGGVLFAITAPPPPPPPALTEAEEYKIMLWTHAHVPN
jgi:hypothetical protein